MDITVVYSNFRLGSIYHIQILSPLFNFFQLGTGGLGVSLCSTKPALEGSLLLDEGLSVFQCIASMIRIGLVLLVQLVVVQEPKHPIHCGQIIVTPLGMIIGKVLLEIPVLVVFGSTQEHHGKNIFSGCCLCSLNLNIGSVIWVCNLCTLKLHLY